MQLDPKKIAKAKSGEAFLRLTVTLYLLDPNTSLAYTV